MAIDENAVHEILGATRFENEVALRTSVPGVWAAGTAAGVSVHTIITAGDGARVAINLISATKILFSNLLAYVIYAVIDPRIKYS